MSTIETLIKGSSAKVFRKAYLKRRNADATGTYASWLEITDYVKKWGSVSYEVADEKASSFKLSGAGLTFRNDEGKFNRKEDSNSFWNGYLSEYKSKFKVEAGYYDGVNTLPTNSSIFIGVLTDDIDLNNKNEVSLNIRSLASVFDDVPASMITGLTGSQTASDIVTLIKDMRDTNSVSVFGNFFSASAWNIQTTTNIYSLLTTNTSQSIGDKSCWDLIKELAEAENMITYVDGKGNFFFNTKVPTTTTQFTFTGHGIRNTVTGKTIKEVSDYTLATSKIYTKVRVRFNEADTTTSFYTKAENWTIGDGSTSWRYGQRTYDLSNYWIPTATAQVIGDNLYADFATAKEECTIKTKFIPHLNLIDRVKVQYSQGGIGETPTLWGHFLWGKSSWGTSGLGTQQNFVVDSTFKIMGISQDIDKFESSFKLRGV